MSPPSIHRLVVELRKDPSFLDQNTIRLTFRSGGTAMKMQGILYPLFQQYLSCPPPSTEPLQCQACAGHVTTCVLILPGSCKGGRWCPHFAKEKNKGMKGFCNMAKATRLIRGENWGSRPLLLSVHNNSLQKTQFQYQMCCEVVVPS